MSRPQKIKSYLQSDWLISFLLLAVYLATRGYRYGWDDQHVEIPLLKSLIDPALYPHDYYVQSLKLNFTSFLYPLLARIITVEQVPTAYFALYLLSRFFLVFFSYKIWKFLSGRKDTAFLCVSVFILFGRVPEFLYRTFSHQEFALGIIFGGIYFFYKERFLLASVILGVAANFHALYSLYPMGYIAFYLLLNYKKHGIKTLLKSAGVYCLCILPVLIWIVQKKINAPAAITTSINWVSLYHIACQETFIFAGVPFHELLTHLKLFYALAERYLLAIALILLNMCFNPAFKKDSKTHAVIFVTMISMIAVVFVSYVYPVRFILDLNLVRNIQFLFFFLMGRTVMLAWNLLENQKSSLRYSAILFLGFLSLNDAIAILSTFFIMILLFIEKKGGSFKKFGRLLLLPAVAAIIWLILKTNSMLKFGIFGVFAVVTIIFFIFKLRPLKKHPLFLKILLTTIPLGAIFTYQVCYHIERINTEAKAGGFWKLQRDWEDMGRFVQKNTPKEAVIFTPHDMEMGGFRIYSERPTVVCSRDCGIIGFDYNAALEWAKRVHDVEAFKVKADSPITPSVANAILKYKADYMVALRYYEQLPGFPHNYPKIYQNDHFSLFKLR